MKTPTHFLMTAALRKTLPQWKMSRSAVLLGSIAPDLALYGLTFGGLFYFQYVEGWTLRESARHIFGTLYFNDPIWIGLHNFLHSPLNLVLLLIANRIFLSGRPVLATWVRWFLLACLLHSVVDIFTHYDDGPLLLWPLNWELRFQSPVSYWDHRHFGSEASKFELVFVLVMIAYLTGPWILEKLKAISGRTIPDKPHR